MNRKLFQNPQLRLKTAFNDHFIDDTSVYRRILAAQNIEKQRKKLEKQSIMDSLKTSRKHRKPKYNLKYYHPMENESHYLRDSTDPDMVRAEYPLRTDPIIFLGFLTLLMYGVYIGFIQFILSRDAKKIRKRRLQSLLEKSEELDDMVGQSQLEDYIGNAFSADEPKRRVEFDMISHDPNTYSFYPRISSIHIPASSTTEESSYANQVRQNRNHLQNDFSNLPTVSTSTTDTNHLEDTSHYSGHKGVKILNLENTLAFMNNLDHQLDSYNANINYDTRALRNMVEVSQISSESTLSSKGTAQLHEGIVIHNVEDNLDTLNRVNKLDLKLNAYTNQMQQDIDRVTRSMKDSPTSRSSSDSTSST